MEETPNPDKQAQAQEVSRYAGHDPDLVPVSRFLGVEHLNELPPKDQGHMESILKWVREKSGQDRIDMMMTLRNLERELDPPPIGVSRLEQLYQWISLDLEEKRILKAKQSFRRA